MANRALLATRLLRRLLAEFRTLDGLAQSLSALHE
jgi:hypothetical protein